MSWLLHPTFRCLLANDISQHYLPRVIDLTQHYLPLIKPPNKTNNIDLKKNASANYKSGRQTAM